MTPEVVNSSVLPDSQAPPATAPEVELWEPPFERWLRMADDLLRDWPKTRPAVNNRL
jgi:hypothetical protein